MKIHIKNSQNRQFYFVIKATNGRILATSETYRTKLGCRKGIAALRRATTPDQVIDES